MATGTGPHADEAINRLRADIQKKYEHYHQLDRDRFPDFVFNTNRANYKPLRASFEVELYTNRGIDPTSTHLRIPSTDTLALLFTNNQYVPGPDLLEACRLYAEEYVPPADIPVTLPTKPGATSQWKTVIVALACFIGVVALVWLGWSFFRPAATGLVIKRPTSNSMVPQELVIEGHVANAETIWLAVRYKNGADYWIQPPVQVQDNGDWIGVVYIGGVGTEHVGLTYQIRGFVNPARPLKSGEIYYAWPEAEHASAIVEVVRK